MALVVVDTGEPILLNWMLRVALAVDEPLHLHLFQSDSSIYRDTVLADLAEATFSGYDVVELARSVWRAPEELSGVAYSIYGVGFIQWLPLSGGQLIYGYYVTDAADTVLIWAERFSTPILAGVSAPVLVQPQMRLHSEIEPPPP